MARGINKVILVGNLGADPKVNPNRTAAQFSVATTEGWKDRNSGEQKERTEWHKVVAFKRLAEIAAEYLRKGSKVYIEGKLQTSKWQDNNGVDRYTTQVVISEFQMLDRPNNTGRDDGRGNEQEPPPPDDDDIPY